MASVTRIFHTDSTASAQSCMSTRIFQAYLGLTICIVRKYCVFALRCGHTFESILLDNTYYVLMYCGHTADIVVVVAKRIFLKCQGAILLFHIEIDAILGFRCMAKLRFRAISGCALAHLTAW